MRAAACHIPASILLLAATILLIVASISAPVVNHIAILVVRLPEDASGEELIFGTFGHCVEHGADNREDLCSSPRLGYSPLDVARGLDLVTPATYVRTTARALTRVMILHPIAAVLSALAFVFVLASPVLGSSLACLFSTGALIIAALAMVSDFVLFGMVRSAVNQDGRPGSRAKFGVAMWCVLVASICTFVATLFVMVSCCVGRSRRRRRDTEKAGEAPVAPAPEPTAAPAVTPEAAPADGAAQPTRRFWKRG